MVKNAGHARDGRPFWYHPMLWREPPTHETTVIVQAPDKGNWDFKEAEVESRSGRRTAESAPPAVYNKRRKKDTEEVWFVRPEDAEHDPNKAGDPMLDNAVVFTSAGPVEVPSVVTFRPRIAGDLGDPSAEWMLANPPMGGGVAVMTKTKDLLQGMSHYEVEALLRPCVLESPDDPEDIVKKYAERRFLVDRLESWKLPYQRDTRSMDEPGRRNRPLGFTSR